VLHSIIVVGVAILLSPFNKKPYDEYFRFRAETFRALF